MSPISIVSNCKNSKGCNVEEVTKKCGPEKFLTMSPIVIDEELGSRNLVGCIIIFYIKNTLDVLDAVVTNKRNRDNLIQEESAKEVLVVV